MRAFNSLTHEPGSAERGRAFHAVDGRRASVQKTDVHSLQSCAGRMEREIREASVPSVVLIAPARALSVLRESLGPPVRVAADGLARDCVRQPLYEVERHLMGLQSKDGA